MTTPSDGNANKQTGIKNIFYVTAHSEPSGEYVFVFAVNAHSVHSSSSSSRACNPYELGVSYILRQSYRTLMYDHTYRSAQEMRSTANSPLFAIRNVESLRQHLMAVSTKEATSLHPSYPHRNDVQGLRYPTTHDKWREVRAAYSIWRQ